MSEKATKPLRRKAYGSIGHLPQSRTGPGDWHIHAGQAALCLEKPRRGDRVVVTEKLDGACMAVARVGGDIVALMRAGYTAAHGAYPHLRAFVPFVEANRRQFEALLKEGERVVGEWLAMAHGTRYDEAAPGFAPFIVFDLFRDDKRVLTDEFEERVGAVGLMRRAKIHDGPSALSIEGALNALGPRGFHGAIDPVEGAVWRVEAGGEVDFLAKFVRHDKRDGCFLPDRSGAEHWNCPSLRLDEARQ